MPLSATSVPGSQARALVTILGVAREKDALPERVEATLRIENLGTVAVTVPLDGLGLVAGDLTSFGTPVLRGQTTAVPPGGTGVFELLFPLPEGRDVDHVDWSGLNLRFALEFEGSRVTTGATFTRNDYPYWYDEPRVRIGVGFGTTWN